MNDFSSDILRSISRSGLGRLAIKAPFTIPSGVVTTVPSVLARIARDVPEVGFLTTKTLSLEPREGYREPVLHEYYPGCWVNAVGLANPGASLFVEAMGAHLPLHDNKPLVVSIMGGSPDEFLECAQILSPVADAFELNLSCPHVTGAGQSVGSDPAAVHAIISLLKQSLRQPVIPKLSPNLDDVAGMAALCQEAGADALTLINTVGPGTAVDDDGNPVLSNVNGGLSGAGILPIGLKAVREAAQRVKIPIIASGGIGSARHVEAYRRAGAALFSVGSALGGMRTPEIAAFFSGLAKDLTMGDPRPDRVEALSANCRTHYIRTVVKANRPAGPDMFELCLEHGPNCKPGNFFFLRIPGVGEKPFSPAADREPRYLVRPVGPFTGALQRLRPGDPLYMRGPYGNGFPDPLPEQRIILMGGGTGSAPIIMAARRWKSLVTKAFFGFSQEPCDQLRAELMHLVDDCIIAVDSDGKPGEVVHRLSSDVAENGRDYREASVFLCGPSPMMKSSVECLKKVTSVDRIYTAREDLMRCGIGICGSCGTSEGLRSCVDGPVMAPE